MAKTVTLELPEGIESIHSEIEMGSSCVVIKFANGRSLVASASPLSESHECVAGLYENWEAQGEVAQLAGQLEFSGVGTEVVATSYVPAAPAASQ